MAGLKETQWDILSTAMPSVSFAAAANAMDSMPGVDMMSLKNGWPVIAMRQDEYKASWYHSDFWLLAPTYVRRMYEKQIERGGLNHE